MLYSGKVQRNKDAAKTVIETTHKILDYMELRFGSPGDYFYERGLSQFKKGRFTSAGKFFSRSFDKKFKRYTKLRAGNQYLKCLLKVGDYDFVVEESERLSLEFDNVTLNFHKGLAYEKLNEAGNAIYVYQDIHESNPEHRLSNIKLGDNYFSKRDFGNASRHFKLAIDSERYDQESRVKLINCFKEMGLQTEAESQYDELINQGYKDDKGILGEFIR